MSFDQVVAEGKKKPVPFFTPSPESLGLIMYTSGSTGKPKGVMLTHKSISAAAGGLEAVFKAEMPGGERPPAGAPADFKGQEVYLAYLPAAHILEFSAEMSMLVHGACIGYSCPRSIASTGAARKLPDGTINFEATGFGKCPPGGIQEFAPTFFAGVPKVWDIFKKGIEAKMGESAALGYIFQAFFSWTSFAMSQGRTTPLCNLLWKKIGGMCGGRVKIGVVGGGPTHPDLQNFVRVAFGFNLVQGYALTETCSAGTLQHLASVTDGVAGSPLECVEIKLRSETDVKDKDGKPYLITDKSHYGTPCLGRGESCIRGAPVSSGYYLMEDKTREEFDSEGWFHTGDVAIWTEEGHLKIVDRIKNLVKLKGGEYIALEAMESTYSNSVFVDGKKGGVMCYGDGNMDKPIALIMVNLGELKNWAAGAGITGDTVDLCSNPAAIKHVLGDLNGIGKNGGLGRNELLKNVGLLPGIGAEEDSDVKAPWTPANTYLTASMKLNRKPILAGFKSILDPLIAEAS
jgi:long-chain acyl-CoA synthetase